MDQINGDLYNINITQKPVDTVNDPNLYDTIIVCINIYWQLLRILYCCNRLPASEQMIASFFMDVSSEV